MKYIKTWTPGHYGEIGSHATEYWEKTDLEVYNYVTNNYIKAVRIGDRLYQLDMRNSCEIIPSSVDNEEVEKYINSYNHHMTDYTSY